MAEKPNTIAEALASAAGNCSTSDRTIFVGVISKFNGVSIEIAFFDLIQEHGPTPSGYTKRVPILHGVCKNTPPFTPCRIDPCTQGGGQPIFATRVQCGAKFVWTGGQKDIQFPDKVSSPGKYIVDCQFAISPRAGYFAQEGTQSSRLIQRLEDGGDMSEFLEISTIEGTLAK